VVPSLTPLIIFPLCYYLSPSAHFLSFYLFGAFLPCFSYFSLPPFLFVFFFLDLFRPHLQINFFSHLLSFAFIRPRALIGPFPHAPKRPLSGDLFGDLFLSFFTWETLPQGTVAVSASDQGPIVHFCCFLGYSRTASGVNPLLVKVIMSLPLLIFFLSWFL